MLKFLYLYINPPGAWTDAYDFCADRILAVEFNGGVNIGGGRTWKNE